MEENAIISQEPQADRTWKIKTLAIGSVLGALTGLGAAFLLTKRAEQKGERLSISSGKGVKLGMLIASLLRQILSLGGGITIFPNY